MLVEELVAKPPTKPEYNTTPKNAEGLETIERQHIIKILKECNWVVSGPKGAAKRLDMHRATLQYRMKKLGIQKTER